MILTAALLRCAPEAFWPLICVSWHRDEASLYGRLDLRFNGHGPAKLLEYNADTPTSIFEAAVFQWRWLEQAIERLAPLPNFSNQYPVLGSWLVDHTPCGLSIREDENPITANTSRFLPHAML